MHGFEMCTLCTKSKNRDVSWSRKRTELVFSPRSTSPSRKRLIKKKLNEIASRIAELSLKSVGKGDFQRFWSILAAKSAEKLESPCKKPSKLLKVALLGGFRRPIFLLPETRFQNLFLNQPTSQFFDFVTLRQTVPVQPEINRFGFPRGSWRSSEHFGFCFILLRSLDREISRLKKTARNFAATQ